LRPTTGRGDRGEVEIIPSDEVEEATKNDLNMPYFDALKTSKMLKFAESAPPPGVMVRARITVNRGVFTEYTFSIETADERNVIPVMKTQRKKTSTSAQYSINMLTDNRSYIKFGRLNSNFTRTKYTLMGNLNEDESADLAGFSENSDFWENANKNDKDDKKNTKNKSRQSSMSDSSKNDRPIKKYFDLEYFNKVFGRSKPKDILLDLTVAQSGGDLLRSERKGSGVSSSSSIRKNKHMMLVTKKPEYDPETKTFRLDFDGRVKLPSASNVQLVDEKKPNSESVLLQLGKCDSKSYAIDYQYPFTAFSAFGFAISCLSRG
jgi:hypothetical protein